MAQKVDDPGGNSFLIKTPSQDNRWLVNKADVTPGYSVLEEYYKRQAQQKNQYTGPSTYIPRYGPTGQTMGPQQPPRVDAVNQWLTTANNNVTGAFRGAAKSASSWLANAGWNMGRVGGNTVQAATTVPFGIQPNYITGPSPYPQFDFNNWYRNITGGPTQAIQARTMAPSSMGELRRWEGPYQYNPTGAYSNQVYGPSGYLSPMNTGSQIYKGNKVPIGMQRWEEIQKGNASPEMLLYGSAARVNEHLPPPPTAPDSNAAGSGYGSGVKPAYSGGGGYSSAPAANRWWTDPTIWRI